MGPGRVELPTLRLSGVRSNQLSYEPRSTALSFEFFVLSTVKNSKLSTHTQKLKLGSSVISINLKKSNKKTADYNCQRYILRTL